MRTVLGFVASLLTCSPVAALSGAEPGGPVGPRWYLPAAAEVQLGGTLGEADRRGIARLGEDPYRSVVFLRSDLSFEIVRDFTNYSGDISGRFLEIASLTSPPDKPTPPVLEDLLKTITDYQQPDGHFGRPIDWNTPIDDASISTDPGRAVRTPVFWGHSRLLVGLLEAYAAFHNPKLLQAARGIGDFYVATAPIYCNPEHEALFKSTGSYSASYVTDYFPAIEGIVRLYRLTQDGRYLRQAERMAEFFQRFDSLPIDHSHGNLITYHGLLLLYETTGQPELLRRVRDRWNAAMEGGYVWPIGGVGERFRRVSEMDEGCSEADWLRLNLDLWRVTGETRYLDAAERLLGNHYAMNRTANGGYGHHFFVSDEEGPLFMQPKFMEATWCCTFHGILGMHTLKSYLVASSERGIFVNFLVDVTAPVRVGTSLWNVQVSRQPDTDGSIACRLCLDSPANRSDTPDLFLRRPHWAEQVTISDVHGKPVEASEEAGYLRLPARAGAEGELSVTFSFAPRVENRRMQVVKLDPSQLTRHSGVVLAVGPRVLLANAEQPRPALVVRVDREGRLQLPSSDGIRKVAMVPSLDAPAPIPGAAAPSGMLELAPWEGIDPKRGAAFVFDLLTVPAER